MAVGELFAAGFGLLPTFSAPHYSTPAEIMVTLPADVNQVDDTGFVWALLGDSGEPERVQPGTIIVAGDPAEPFLARVVDIVDGPGDDSIVHLDVLGIPDQTIEALRHAGLLPA